MGISHNFLRGLTNVPQSDPEGAVANGRDDEEVTDDEGSGSVSWTVLLDSSCCWSDKQCLPECGEDDIGMLLLLEESNTEV